MVSFREFVNAFRELGLDRSRPVLVHASLSAVGEIRGGTDTVLGALLPAVKGIMAPTFTYKTMVIPEVGPPDNAILYGSGKNQNHLAEFFHPEMPADPTMGALPEAVRTHPDSKRSLHPILSFAGIHVDEALDAQTIEEPLAPIQILGDQEGLVLLIGVDNTVNTSIHYAERLAGRKHFTRWALTPQGVRECPGFPGCSDGFEQAASLLKDISRTARIGSATVRSIPISAMVEMIASQIQKQPDFLLCHKTDERCEAIRRSLQQTQHE